jgi:hypothetical protein
MWLKRIGLWMLAALAVIIPAFGWLRERRRRQAAEQRWRDEVERGQRAAEVARALARIEKDRHAREAKVRVEAESRAVAHETHAAGAMELVDDLDALVAELARTGRK